MSAATGEPMMRVFDAVCPPVGIVAYWTDTWPCRTNSRRLSGTGFWAGDDTSPPLTSGATSTGSYTAPAPGSEPVLVRSDSTDRAALSRTCSEFDVSDARICSSTAARARSISSVAEECFDVSSCWPTKLMRTKPRMTMTTSEDMNTLPMTRSWIDVRQLCARCRHASRMTACGLRMKARTPSPTVSNRRPASPAPSLGASGTVTRRTCSRRHGSSG